MKDPHPLASSPTMTTGRANRNKGKHTLTHKRNEEDNETVRCESLSDGDAASLSWPEVNCPACRRKGAQDAK